MTARPTHHHTARRLATDPRVTEALHFLAQNQQDTVATMTAFRQRMRAFARVALSQDKGDFESGARAMLIGWRALMTELGGVET